MCRSDNKKLKPHLQSDTSRQQDSRSRRRNARDKMFQESMHECVCIVPRHFVNLSLGHGRERALESVSKKWCGRRVDQVLVCKQALS